MELPEFDDLRFFAGVAAAGTLTEVARQWGVSVSAVSKRLARLERRLGVRLVNRSTRRLTLTDEGRRYAEGARDVLGRIDDLEDEIGRVVRARVVNPKWLAGVMRHGYKGAFEMAATVDYLFAFAATARVVSDHHFDAVYEAYLNDDEVLDFLRRNNPAALREMAERMAEALERGLWRTRSNSIADGLKALITGEQG